jgi:hypothetical protein
LSLTVNQKNHSIQDRYHLDISIIDGSATLSPNTGTYFVLSPCSQLTSPTISTKGCYAAMIQQGNIFGQALSIYMPGIQRSHVKVVCIDPTVPGNLTYIDGCSNSNLVDPDRNGDPCINYLFFPSGIQQTFHVHPSLRIGYIINGEGLADFYDAQGNLQSQVLKSGDTFVLDRLCRHRFQTAGSIMSLLIFHPDSEDGPRDDHNPMKTRTYLY